MKTWMLPPKSLWHVDLNIAGKRHRRSVKGDRDSFSGAERNATASAVETWMRVAQVGNLQGCVIPVVTCPRGNKYVGKRGTPLDTAWPVSLVHLETGF